MDRIPNNDLVAVYGSLREGLGNHRVIADAERKEDGIISGQFRMISLGGFPGLLKDDRPVDIVVEVYEIINQSTAVQLDYLEGYPTFYDREKVKLTDGRECWVYFLDDSYADNAPVPSGDWKQFRRYY